MLKTLIVLLMIALVASLASGLVFLMSDRGNPDKKRLFTSLGVRLGLGACLLLVILYGVMTGQLGHQNHLGPRPDSRQRVNVLTRQPLSPATGSSPPRHSKIANRLITGTRKHLTPPTPWCGVALRKRTPRRPFFSRLFQPTLRYRM